MVRIMADVHTAEAVIETRQSYPDTALMTFNHAKREILEQHNVTAEQFKETYDFYLEHVDQMDKLYEVVIDTLSVREAKFNAKNEPLQKLEEVAQ